MRERPTCYYCGIRYGRRLTKRDDTLVARDAETPPPRRTNLTLLRTERYPYGDQDKVVHIYWDGESISTPHEPFCTLLHALYFAREAIVWADEHGIRLHERILEDR